jgi:hypothetical protein
MTTIIDGTAGITFPNSTVQASAGQVLQVVSATYGVETSNSTSTLANTGLSATITPKFATSKILVLVNQAGCSKQTGNTYLVLKLYRNTTEILQFEGVGAYTANSTENNIGSCSCAYIDSPATTSATTYKTMFASVANTALAQVQRDSTSTITLLEIAA